MKSCYLCRKNPVRYLFSNNGYPIYRCTHCGLGQTSLAVPYGEFVASYYDEGYFTGDSSRCAYDNYERDFLFMKKNFNGMLTAVQRFQDGGSLLDVGCATGKFLGLARKLGYNVFGIEPSSYAAALARKRFPRRITQSTVEKAQFVHKKFQVITMLDVFEHLDDPRAALVQCRDWLSDSGLLVVATNDFDSLWAKIMGQKWHFLIPPQHLFYFTQKTIQRILSETGFTIETIERPGKWITLGYGLHLGHTIQHSLLARSLQRIVKRLRLSWLPLYLNFFDHMVVYARKA